MKNKRLLKLSMLLLVGISLLILTALPCPAKVIHWKMVNYGVAGSWFYRELGPPLADRIKSMSDGRIVIKTFPTGVIVPSAEIFAAVSKGTLDLAVACPPYHGGILPMADIEWGYPGSWRNREEFLLLHDYFGFSEIQRKAYAEHNIHFLEHLCGGGISLISKKPVRSLADLKGMKIRAIGGMAEVLKKGGASVTWIPAPEIYTALSTGVVDGVVYGHITDANDLKLQEVAKYWISPNLQAAQGATVILVNMKRWNELSDDLKAIVQGAARTMRGRHYLPNLYDGQKVLKDWQEKYRVKVTSLSEKDRKQLAAWSEEEMDKLAAKDPKYSAEAIKCVKELWKSTGFR